MIKVLVVDDSVLMRNHLRSILSKADCTIEIARNGRECLEKIPRFNPDVITLDINMPVMDGLSCLKRIMAEFPTPVIMVSSLTEKGAIASLDALEAGAVDYIPKPKGPLSLNMSVNAQQLIEKVKHAAAAPVTKKSTITGYKSPPRPNIEDTRYSGQTPSVKAAATKLILIGVSTGGPSALQKIIPQLPPDFPVPIVIAQHMPEKFTPVFSERLNSISKVTVKEVTNTTELLPREVYVAKGDSDINISKNGGKLIASSTKSNSNYLWHPSVEHMVESAIQVIESKHLLCVQLTGMGNDGAKAMAKAHSLGAKTIAESQKTAVVFGMPKELIEMSGADKILPCEEIGKAIIDCIQNPNNR